MKKLTIILLNLRFSDFYSTELFKRIKKVYQVRIVAVLDQHFKTQIGRHILPYLDDIYSLQAQTKDGFLAEFNFDQLCQIVEKELLFTSNIKIVCTDEFNLLHAGRLRRQYDLFGNTDLDLLIFRDKARMKSLLQQANVRVPRFKLLQADDDFADLSRSIGLPFVIKPVDSCGSFGVHIVREQMDYIRIAMELKHSTAKFEVEEYIEGKLYHVDSCTQNNEINFICANEYSCPNYDYTKGKVLGSIPLDDSSELAQSLINFSRHALSVLGSLNLINHMEIFVTPQQELVFLEVSARPPGGLLNFTHQINFSINLMDLDFFIQTGLHVELPNIVKSENAFWMLFPLLPGKIKKFQTPKLQSRVDMSYFREIGDYISPNECKSIVEKSAHAIFYHGDKTTLRSDFEYMRTFNLMEMEVK